MNYSFQIVMLSLLYAHQHTQLAWQDKIVLYLVLFYILFFNILCVKKRFLLKFWNSTYRCLNLWYQEKIVSFSVLNKCDVTLFTEF